MDREDLSDEQLMLMFRYGNRAAFDLLFEKHRAAIYNYARRMLADRESAEDVCQDVFLSMVAAAKHYEPSASFKTWIFTIARNRCLNARRRPRMLPLEESGVAADGRIGDPPVHLAAMDTAGELERAIAALPAALRETFLLRVRHAMSYDQIAQITGRSLGSVKTHIHRARQRLAERLKDSTR